ncbi:MAG: enoyl-CoA hydratase/isomerase family protein, partial [Myxococcales bacterium]|nr:enoyl-CoA hydratase/isomerase family protein [Myxococcales bacterium]
MTNKTLLLEKRGYIATVTLNRPERLNAINMQLADELHDALSALDADDDTRVIVLTGAGRA